MATIYKTVLVFNDADGKAVTFSYKWGRSECNLSDVKAAMNAFIENGAIFRRVPVSARSAYTVATEQTDYSVSN